jgi:hypothetical protein
MRQTTCAEGSFERLHKPTRREGLLVRYTCSVSDGHVTIARTLNRRPALCALQPGILRRGAAALPATSPRKTTDRVGKEYPPLR